jgi:peptidoglycan/xylan/chitin deacetylase (PgdA/CDA1 family)
MSFCKSHLSKDLFDIFAAKEEYSGEKDRYGRFLHAFSTNKNVFRPLVSNYLVEHGLLHVYWPENHRFAAFLTHDIDTVSPSWKNCFFAAAKLALRLPQKSLGRLANKIKRDNSQNPYWNFKKIVDLEKKYDAKSTFFFKAAIKDNVRWVYDINNLRNELHFLVDQKWEVGLHSGFYSFNDPIALRKEKAKMEDVLGKKILGVRNHYLRFGIPETWKLLANLGFEYDTSFGYPDMPGFRNGMCHPFKPYDLFDDKEIDILEIPLVIMDNSLLRMDQDKAWALVKYLINNTAKSNGVITILWHNTSFDEVIFDNAARLYERILHLLRRKNAWMTSGEEIFRFWMENGLLIN